MLMKYELYGRCMWHYNCQEAPSGGVMKQVKWEKEHDLFECLHCGKTGYYPVGAVGCVEVDEQGEMNPQNNKKIKAESESVAVSEFSEDIDREFRHFENDDF